MMNSSYASLVAGGERAPRACFREAVGPGEGGLVAEASASALIGIAALVRVFARGGRLEGGREGEVGVDGQGADGLGVAVAPLVEGEARLRGGADRGLGALVVGAAARDRALVGVGRGEGDGVAALRASGRGASAVLGGRGLEGVAVGQADDVVLVHVLVEHLVDVGEAHLSLHALHQLVVCRALLARGLRGAVGVEPGRADHLACGKLRLLGLLLLRGRPLVGVDDLRQADLVARTVGGEVVARLVAVLAADALDDIDRDDFCHSFFF